MPELPGSFSVVSELTSAAPSVPVEALLCSQKAKLGPCPHCNGLFWNRTFLGLCCVESPTNQS